MADSLSDYFRRGGRLAQAVPTFTNRVAELQRFEHALLDHDQWRSSIDPLDPDLSRRNLLNYYGVGGIGKSTLLTELSNKLKHGRAPSVSARVDFQQPSSYDIEEVVLRIRTTIGELGIKCVAFDFALAFYWNLTHPGETIDAYTKNRSLLHRATQRMGLSSSIEASVVEVVSSVVGASQLAHGASRLAHTVGKLVADRARVKHAIAGCAVLPRFLDPDNAEQMISYMPALLAWDLAQAGNPRVVIFFDTYEEVTRKGRHIENSIQRLCYMLPNALFVIAGRNRVDWDNYNLRGSLDYIGPITWPDLNGAEEDIACRSMLVGDLSATDAEEYLKGRLVKDGLPAIPEEVRQQIVVASGGWPLYLDIAAAQYQQALQEGTAGASDFGVPFPALVTRLLADLSLDERNVVRAAALLGTFSEDLVHAGAGGASYAAVRQVTDRAFVKQDSHAGWPFSLHPALRAALRSDLAWTERDWSACAQRILNWLGVRAEETDSPTELAICVEQGLLLSHEYNVFCSWLSNGGRKLAAWGSLSSVRYLGASNTHAGSLSLLLETVEGTYDRPFLDAASALEECLNPALADADRFWARSLQASALLSAGENARAETLFRELLSEGTRADLSSETQTMYSLMLLKRGAFVDLEEYIAANGDAVDIFRLKGDIHRLNAQWSLAHDQYMLGLARAQERHDVGLMRLFEAELALVDGWSGTADPRRWASDTDQKSEPWPEVSRIIAEALYVSTHDRTESERLLDEAEAIAASFGLADGVADVLIARSFLAALYGAPEQLAKLFADITERVNLSGTHANWLDVVRLWSGGAPEATSTVQWLGGPERAYRDWLGTLESRQRSL